MNDWASFIRTLDGKPASISVNLDAMDLLERDSRRRHLLTISTKLRKPRADGLCRSREEEPLFRLEIALFEHLRPSGDYVGHVTTDRRRRFLWYTNSTDAAVPRQLAGYRVSQDMVEDGEWWQFRDLLPNAVERQSVHTDRQVREHEQAGDVLDIPRTVEHWVAFVAESGRQAFIAYAAGQRFRVDEEWQVVEDQRPYCVRISRREALSQPAFSATVSDLAQRAVDLGGEYLAWNSTRTCRPEHLPLLDGVNQMESVLS